MNGSAWIAQLYETEAVGVFRFILGMVQGDRALAEDLTGATFQKALEGADGLTNAASARAWLFAIARNEVRMCWRRGRLIQWVRWSPVRDARTTAPAAGDQRLDLCAVLARLNAADREIILLVGLLDLTAEEAGTTLGISAEAAQKRWQRARERFLALASQADRITPRPAEDHSRAGREGEA